MSLLPEKAHRIKEDLLSSLPSTQGCLQSEAFSYRLLESHIHTITQVVKQLSADIQVLERQIAHRDIATSGTSAAVQSMYHKNLTGIGDLRGRVARCDASNAKLSGDVSAVAQEIIRLRQEVLGLRSVLGERLQEMETQLSQALSRLEASLVKQNLSQRNSWTKLQHHVNMVEARSSGGLKEVREEAVRLRKWIEQELHNSTQTRIPDSEGLRSLLKDKMVEAEGRLGLLSERVERTERRLEKQDDSRLKRLEVKFHSRISAVESSFREELQLIKQDYQSGFQTVRDTIESLRQIIDTKARLDKEKFQKDIKHIRRSMVALGEV